MDVNLPLRVSQKVKLYLSVIIIKLHILYIHIYFKAIMDIRIYWSGNLTSATVFGGEPVKPVVKPSDGSLVDGLEPGEEEGGGNLTVLIIIIELFIYLL